MAVDLKLDIIYYKTPTDFEMEFNLSGCCTMRLLTSKAESAKEYLTDLSKGVSRSKVIIAVGDITDQSGMVNITANAVGLPMCTYDADTYRVSDNESRSVLLPDGALPLVSDDGKLCGCLIESGPQIIIFLTDDKPLRKKILKELVFEYITALSGGGITEVGNTDTVPDDTPANTEQADTTKTDDAIYHIETDDIDDASEDDNTPIEPENEPTDESTDTADNTENFAPDLDFTENTNDDLEELDLNLDSSHKSLKKQRHFLGLKITIGILCTALALIVATLLYYYFIR